MMYIGRRAAWLSVVLALVGLLLLEGCSDTIGPDEEGCFGWYQGFYVLATPESLYLRVELDLTWTIPDSASIAMPLGTVLPDRMFERADPPGLAVVAVVRDALSGWYTLHALYGGSIRSYEEHVAVRSDVLNYDFGQVEPPRGETDVGLTPVIRWAGLRDTQARVRVYADSLRKQGLYDSGGIDDADSLRIPGGVLEPGRRYDWTLEVYDWQTFVPDCTPGYFYMDFFDNGILYVGWFTTVGGVRAESHPGRGRGKVARWGVGRQILKPRRLKG